jgi:hypothetical protein
MTDHRCDYDTPCTCALEDNCTHDPEHERDCPCYSPDWHYAPESAAQTGEKEAADSGGFDAIKTGDSHE